MMKSPLELAVNVVGDPLQVPALDTELPPKVMPDVWVGSLFGA
jgi:hypothetical protein